MIYGELLWIVMAYFLGAVPFGLVIAKTCCHIDPRSHGSGNIGATNIARLCGVPYGILTLACDVAKGALPVWGIQFFTDNALVISLTGLACITGHIYSCFLKFRGGKAVATAIGVFIPLAFWSLLASCALCMFAVWRTGFVSVGSLTLVASLPIFLAFTANWQWIPLAVLICIIVFWKHRENIRRLRLGTENPWLSSKNKAKNQENNNE